VKILYTDLYKTQLMNILHIYAEVDFTATQKFKSYLDTIIINIPTKASKYKTSPLFNDENVKEIEHENFLIFFYSEIATQTFLILGIVEKSE